MAKAVKSTTRKTQPKTGAASTTANATKKADPKALSPTAQKKLEQVKSMANSLCFCIRQDAKSASKGTVSIEKVRKMFKGLQESILDARREMYRDSK